MKKSAKGTTMGMSAVVSCLFLDIGGVLLTDGWGHRSRRRASAHFKLEFAEMEDRHKLTWNTYQEGNLTLDEYLNLVVFHRKRPFSRSQFRRFIFEQSKPFPETIAMISQLKLRHGLKIVVLSNEGRELNDYRIRKFKLNEVADFFVSSCFIQMLKPDPNIFRLALDMAQTPARQVIYIENTRTFVEIAEQLGIRSVLHTDYISTRAKLASFGLRTDDLDVHASR